MPPMMNAGRRRRYGLRARRRHIRRNPGMLGLGNIKSLIPPVRQIAEGALGAAATRMIPALAANYISPAIPTHGPAGYAVKAGAALLAGMAGSAVLGPQSGRNIAAGGFIILADQVLRENVYPSLPVPLGAYLGHEGMGAYLGQYLNPGAVLPALPGSHDLGDYMDVEDGEFGSMDQPSRLDANERL